MKQAQHCGIDSLGNTQASGSDLPMEQAPLPPVASLLLSWGQKEIYCT